MKKFGLLLNILSGTGIALILTLKKRLASGINEYNHSC